MAIADSYTTQQPVCNDHQVFDRPVETRFPEVGEIPSSRLLIVDDEENLRVMYVEILSEFGYDVTGAVDAEDALELLNSHEYNLVITDMRLPGMSGTDLYESACVTNPELAGRFVFSSGDSHTLFLQDFALHTGNRCLEKPFSLVQLLGTVREMLGVFAPSLA